MAVIKRPDQFQLGQPNKSWAQTAWPVAPSVLNKFQAEMRPWAARLMTYTALSAFQLITHRHTHGTLPNTKPSTSQGFIILYRELVAMCSFFFVFNTSLFVTHILKCVVTRAQWSWWISKELLEFSGILARGVCSLCILCFHRGKKNSTWVWNDMRVNKQSNNPFK